MAGDTTQVHGGVLAADVARRYGVQTMWTLSGAHVFPLYDAAVTGDSPMRLIDVRHEQSAVFAAEATAKLTRTPGLAVLTAGPGVTNGVSAVTSAWFNGSPLLVLGGRAPAFRWGMGSLQELDHPPLLAPVTKYAGTVDETAGISSAVDEALRLATMPHRGPVFLDVPMDVLYSRAPAPAPTSGSGPAQSPSWTPAGPTSRLPPEPEALAAIAALVGAAKHPVLVLGSDVWADRAEEAARRAAETLGLPVITNGMGRGILPAGHRLLVTRARSVAFGGADVVIVVGAPLDFRLAYGVFGGRDDAPPAAVVHIADSPGQVARHVALAASTAGDLSAAFDGLVEAWSTLPRPASYEEWVAELRVASDVAVARDREVLHSDATPIHPARIYGELIPRLSDDAVVIGDGGDFVSFAGRYVEPRRPGGWLDPGPYGCLGTGLGYAMAARVARPRSPVVLLLGDGAAGFSLMDVDTLVRHRLPVVMIVGNNGMWGLEKHPMQFLYGYDVAAELQDGLAYDGVVRALGGAGETVTSPSEIGPALDRAFGSAVPYLVNVITDPSVAYPRSTTGI